MANEGEEPAAQEEEKQPEVDPIEAADEKCLVRISNYREPQVPAEASADGQTNVNQSISKEKTENAGEGD